MIIGKQTQVQISSYYTTNQRKGILSFSMKLVTWNCNGATKPMLAEARPFGKLSVFGGSKRCEDPLLSTLDTKVWAGDYLWVGESKECGIGCFLRRRSSRCSR